MLTAPITDLLLGTQAYNHGNLWNERIKAENNQLFLQTHFLKWLN